MLLPPSRDKVPLPPGEGRVRETSSDVRSGGGLGRGQLNSNDAGNFPSLAQGWAKGDHPSPFTLHSSPFTFTLLNDV
jgi:hypothetical protein